MSNQIRAVLSETAVDVNSVQQYDSLLNFPTVGTGDVIYLDKDDNAMYRFDEEKLRYYCVGRDWKEIKVLNGGNANG
jgi:hypothetical protein|nr:MAG TPA: hypothetical protein [Bacteriophage sp.]